MDSKECLSIANKERLKRDILYLLITGGILGAVFFVLIYGFDVLDFTNDGWLFYTDIDLQQHYVGWCHYRKSAWHFPIGLIDTLSYPNSMSVIYTDSIPLFAVIFKILSPILPVRFQYFGLYGLISFMLSSALSSVLLRRFVGKWQIALMASPFLSLSFPILQRMYYHSALASHWIIFLAFILWLYHDYSKQSYTRIAMWAMMGFLAVSIHSYFLPMVGMILLADIICEVFICKNTRGERVKRALLLTPQILAYCVGALVNLYILGAFYGGGSAYGPGLGTFGSNLNTFYNPIDYGRLLKRLPLYYDFQYEGFAYLGAGVIILIILCVLWLVMIAVMEKRIKPYNIQSAYPKTAIGLFFVSVIIATFPLISINDIKILWIPYIEPVERLLGIFRSNGRFIWVAMYILIITTICTLCHIFERSSKVCAVILAITLIVQGFDMSNLVMSKHEYFTAKREYSPIIANGDTKELIEGKNHFIFLYNENDITLNTAFYGYLHNMYQNSYYYARDINELIDTEIAMNIAKLERGEIDPTAVYIIKNEAYEGNRELFDILPVKSARADDNHIIFVRK